MYKSELIEVVAKQTGLKKADVDAAVTAAFSTIANTMAAGEKVQITGFGTFVTKEREARTGRNPRTGAELKIDACKYPAFSAGATLKALIKNK